jgi:hypothetical protein
LANLLHHAGVHDILQLLHHRPRVPLHLRHVHAARLALAHLAHLADHLRKTLVLVD